MNKSVAYFALLLLVACGGSKPDVKGSEGATDSPDGPSIDSTPNATSSGATSGTRQGGASPMTPGAVPTTGALSQLEGIRWSMSQQDVLHAYTDVGGILDKDYDPQLKKVPPGVQMKNLEAERDSLKEAFRKSLIEFNDTPTGLDGSALRGEYTYKNHESLLRIVRPAKKRTFFFIGDKLWKVYDEVQFGAAGGMGASYPEVVSAVTAIAGTSAKAMAGADYPTTEWLEGTNHIRAVNRTGEKLAGVIYEDKTTLDKLDKLRAAKISDPFAIDPSIAAATKGGVTDPNATGAPAPTGTGKGKPPPKKK